MQAMSTTQVIASVSYKDAIAEIDARRAEQPWQAESPAEREQAEEIHLGAAGEIELSPGELAGV